MDYTYSDKDIILEIEQYMNDKGEALISRMKYIIDKLQSSISFPKNIMRLNRMLMD